MPLLLGGISVAGIGKSLAAAKATSRATSSTGSAVDDAVRSASKSATTVGGKCFVAGTEILTTDGEKSIEDIQVGDWVIADDPTTPGEIEARQVLETFVRHTDKLVDLYIDGEVISTTGEHPFWTPDKGWVEAKDLEVGSLLQTEDGRIIDVDKIEKREGDFTVYNFSVEGFHTYFVSELSVLVHNTCADGNIDPRKLIPTQHRQEMTGSRVKRYTKDMKSNGFNPEHPIVITEVNGRQIILDGHHRVEAAKNAGITEVPYTKVDLSPEEAEQALSDAINASRHRF